MNKKMRLIICTLILTILCCGSVFAAAKEPIVKTTEEGEVDLSSCNTTGAMSVYMKLKINETNEQKGNELVNTYLYALSNNGAFQTHYVFVGAGGSLYIDNDLRGEIITRTEAIPIGKEFDLVVTMTKDLMNVYVDSELIASYNGSEVTGTVGGQWNVVNGGSSGTFFEDIDKKQLKLLEFGNTPECLSWDVTEEADMEVYDFQIYDSELTANEVVLLHKNGKLSEVQAIDNGGEEPQTIIGDVDMEDDSKVSNTVGMIIGIIVVVVILVIVVVVVASLTAKKKK